MTVGNLQQSSSKNKRSNHGCRPIISESRGPPPNDFRTLSVYPTQEEVLSSNHSYIRKNIINGRYENVDHYLDVHFRLLKEDFVAPLREGIREYMLQNRGTNGNNCNLKSSKVKFHSEVIFRSVNFEKERVGAILEFSDRKSRDGIFSPRSERLIYGSLAVFIKNSFGSVAFGKVIDRDCEKKQLVIAFEVKCDDLELDVPYLMVECETLFESYYHVLNALQCKTVVDFPMKSYLIDVDAGLRHPDYLNPISSVYTIGNRIVNLFSNIWPTADQLRMNSSQFSAFKSALTQKFVVIQGPPGTGKTYLGLEIVKTLLVNRKFWYNKTPILIVCYTNHALDQFLEKLLPTTSAIVRVGGQSKNEKLEKFNLKNMKANYKGSPALQASIKAANKQLYLYRNMLKEALGRSRRPIIDKLVSLRLYISELRNQVEAEMMKNNLIIGMTTSGAARLQSTLQRLQCPIVVVEEASEAMEAHITVCLTKHCKHLILIGDHQQLRPKTADYRIEQNFNLGISMFERMVLNKIRCHVLNVQHRMRPKIARLIVPHIYPNLKNHVSVNSFPSVVGITFNVFFIDHKHHEENVDNSKSNLHEAKFLINLACYLRKVGYKPNDVTILTPYASQIVVLHDQSKHFQSLLKDVRISTVDNYQGEECKIILLSLVRNNLARSIGFLKIENRVCVALSRAKEGLYIMGNMELLSRNSELWSKINTTLALQNSVANHLPVYCVNHPRTITELKEPEDFRKVPEGGCLRKCGRLLVCGHTCSQVCHGDSSRNTCKCPKNILIRLPCGHKRKSTCSFYKESLNKPTYQSYEQCKLPCDKRIESCGHTCTYLCHNGADPKHLNQFRCRECYKQYLKSSFQYPKEHRPCYSQVEKWNDGSSLIWPLNLCSIL